MWHPANGHFNHINAFLNLVCRTISCGAGDLERTLRAKVTYTVVLGDSIVEGYGRARNDRIKDRLKADTGTPHLTFESSGVFSLTLAYLLDAREAISPCPRNTVSLTGQSLRYRQTGGSIATAVAGDPLQGQTVPYRACR